MNEFFSKKRYFCKGLLFVGTAYILMKIIDQYQLLFQQLQMLKTAILPFLIAFIFAYLFNPILNWLDAKTKWRRGIQLAFIYITCLLLCFLVVSYIWPIIYQNAADLIKQIPNFASEIQQQLTNWTQKFQGMDLGEFNELKSQLLTSIPRLTEVITNSITSIISAMYGAIMGTGNLLLGFVLSIYLLLEKEACLTIFHRFISICFKKQATNWFNVGQLLHENIGKYLMAKALDSTLVGLLATAGLLLIGSNYAVLLGLIYGITNMIPVFGPIVGTLIAVGVNLFYSPVLALIVFVYLLVIQQIETLVIEPKLVGEKVGLNPILTLLAVTLGGKFMGIGGMILGVPLMSVGKQYVVNFINQRYEKLHPTLLKPDHHQLTQEAPKDEH